MKATKPNTKAVIAAALDEHNKMGYPFKSLPVKLASSIRAIDAFFGDGYAKNHPELLGSCVQSLSLDEMMALGNIEDALNTIGDTRGLEEALNKIAEAIANRV